MNIKTIERRGEYYVRLSDLIAEIREARDSPAAAAINGPQALHAVVQTLEDMQAQELRL